MKFSIIIPVYQVEKYLRPCVESVLSQSYNDYEIILVDDGSPDKCPQICDEYAQKDSRVRVIHQANMGQAGARNSGLKVAKGDYICYIDSDDYLVDNNVLQLLSEKTSGAPDVVHYKFKEWYESDGHTAECQFDYNIPMKERSVAEIYCDLIDKDAYYNSAWSKIIRRDLLIENNINFEQGIVGEDNEWYYHVVMTAKSLVLVDSPLYVYRRRQGSTTTSTTEKNLKDQLHVIKKWENELKHRNDNPASNIVLGSLAKQYCSAIIIYSNIKDAKKYLVDLKKYKYLLNRTKTKRVVLFRNIVRLLGVSGLIVLLKTINKVR